MQKMDVAGTVAASLNRLRRLQNACRQSASFSSLLFVCGVDGRYNWGGNAALQFVLNQHSNRDVLTSRSAEGASVNWGPSESHEALDETFILITRSAVFVFADPGALPLLQPHFSFWSKKFAQEILDFLPKKRRKLRALLGLSSTI
jgi:hypothetical protein